MKKNIGKILLVIGGIILIIGIVFVVQEKLITPNSPNPPIDDNDPNPDKDFEDKEIEEIQTEDKTKNEINELLDAIFEKDISKEKLSKITGQSVDNYYIFYGKDSYIRTLGSDISAPDQYKKKQSEYATKLENKIKDNFDVEATEYIVSADGAIVQRLTYKTYYYTYFIQDYAYLVDELLNYTDVDLGVTAFRELTKEEQEKIYKIQVKALEIMDRHSDKYINKKETKEYELIYRKGDNSITNEYFSLFIVLNGGFYNNTDFSSNGREQRVKTYINEAISSGVFDKSNPYKLK